MMMEVGFESTDKWSSKYQRNNKRNGLKNLRCFPFCSKPHREKGFCGRGVRISVRRQDQEPLFSWGEFCKLDDSCPMQIGSYMTKSEIDNKVRDKNNPTRPWYDGKVFDINKQAEADEEEEKTAKRSYSRKEPITPVSQRCTSVVHFVFNKRKRGWNYSWAANKHTCNALHALFVYIFVPVDPQFQTFRCIGIYQSPTFQVFCRKRQGGDTSAPPPQIANNPFAIFGGVSPTSAYIKSTNNNTNTGSRNNVYLMDSAPSFDVNQSHIQSISYPTSSNFQQQQQQQQQSSAVKVEHYPQPTHFHENGLEFAIDDQEDEESYEDAEEFRKLFIDSFWHEENSYFDRDDNPKNNDVKKRTRENTEETTETTNFERIEKEYSNSSQPITDVFGQSSDGEEEMLNEKLWRLVIVLALAEAHWCEQQLQETTKKALAKESSESSLLLIDESWDDKTNNTINNPKTKEINPDSTFGDMKVSSEQQKIIKNLTNFLIGEATFTQSIADTMSSLPTYATHMERKRAFVRVFHSNIGIFIETQKLTWEQFDLLFQTQQPSVAFLRQAGSRLKVFHESMNSYEDRKKENVLYAEVEPSNKKGKLRDDSQILDASGIWEMDDDLLYMNEYHRSLRGVPWVLRKMIGYMEKVFIVEQTGYERFHMQIAKKLLSNGGILYITDGKARPFTLVAPLPWKQPLAQHYRGWFSPPFLHLEHYYGEKFRMYRILSFSQTENGKPRLKFDQSFQKLNLENNEWETIDHKIGYANYIGPNTSQSNEPPPPSPS